MKNIGILGGTFDPFHLGHLSIMEAAAEERLFDRIILLPARVSPFKIGREIADREDRIAMLECVAAEYPSVTVSRLEIDSTRVSYTFDTLTEMQKQCPGDRLWFIVGSDSLLSLERWYKGRELLRGFSFVLAPRPGFDRTDTEAHIQRYRELYGTEIRILHNRLRDISSTEIKKNIREGKSIDSLVPGPVADYINEHRLYQ